MRDDPKTRIARPRQIYVGERERPYLPLEARSSLRTKPLVQDRELVPV
jgi:hypothetical protein